MQLADLQFTQQGPAVQKKFHESVARTRACSAFIISVHPRDHTADAPLTLLRAFRHDYLAAGGSPWVPLRAPDPCLASPQSDFAACCDGRAPSPPLGVRWTGRSIRSGAATAANAIGLRLAVVAAYMKQSETAVAARHYTDARLLPTAAAWDLQWIYVL